MNETQKIIKYVAIGFAIFLAISIIVGIVSGISSVGKIFSNNNTISDKMIETKIRGNIDFLNVDVNLVNLIIKESKNFKIETNNEDIIVIENDNILEIKEKDSNFFNIDKGDLILYLPESTTFNEVDIEVGVGKVNINNLVTSKLTLELGAGKTTINQLTVTRECKIDGGAGNISIINGNLNDIDLEMGAGNLALSSLITGDSVIDSGVGSLKINLLGTIDDYKIYLNKGLGKVMVDNTNLSDNSIYGNGNNNLKVNGGIGNISIKFMN